MENHTITMEKIHCVVCQYYGVDSEVPFRKGRYRQSIDLRQLIYYISNKLTDLSLSEIGKYNSQITWDHSTVHHSIKSITNRLDVDKKLNIELNAIMELLKKDQIISNVNFSSEKVNLISAITKTKDRPELISLLNIYAKTRSTEQLFKD